MKKERQVLNKKKLNLSEIDIIMILLIIVPFVKKIIISETFINLLYKQPVPRKISIIKEIKIS